jgi:hypothetical protein
MFPNHRWKKVTLPRIRAMALLLIIAVLLTGCFRQPQLEVESGEYTQVRGTDEATRSAASTIQRLQIDREASTARLVLADGSEITLTLATRQSSDWPEGCPTNIYSHVMEVLDVEEPVLTLGALTVRDPVLVRDCPGDPEEIVLRADGVIGGGGGARSESSLIFSRASTGDP